MTEYTEVMTEHEFLVAIDRDLRDCIFYAWIMFGDDAGDLGGAMFELSPPEIIGWVWDEQLYASARR